MKSRAGIVVLFAALAVAPMSAAEGPPGPAPEMQKWSWMVGSWSVAETHEKSAWSPGGKGTGTNVVTLGPGGHSIYYDYKSTGPMGPYAGKGLTTWDPDAKVIRGVWTDNVTPGVSMSECREEGKDLLCSGETRMNGQRVTIRTRAFNPNPAGWTEVMETSTDGTNFQKMMTFEYRKKR